MGFAIAWFVGTHWPNPHLGRIPGIDFADKLYHFTSYAILTTLLLVALRYGKGGRSKWSVWLRERQVLGLAIWGAIVTFGLLDELTQPLVGRSFSYIDLAADASGGAFVLLSIGACRLIAFAYRLRPIERLGV
ncbi:MAG: VanZ family protein [Pirellulaceae bacterium]|nr:VanZ family protein [Pirellulaceae bacterium]MDP7019242.1 VanZ family protein [Pirellulaceae bacterium]